MRIGKQRTSIWTALHWFIIGILWRTGTCFIV